MVVFQVSPIGSTCLFWLAYELFFRRATVGRIPVGEWSARRRDLCLTTHNTHNRQTSMPRVGFEPTISAGERPKTYALDCVATGIGLNGRMTMNNCDKERSCNFLFHHNIMTFVWRKWWKQWSLNEDSWCHKWDLTLAPPKYKSVMVLLHTSPTF